MKAIIFATACIDTDPQRYQSWLDHYAGWDVDLLLVNDGPVRASLDLRGAELKCFPDRLGRPEFFQFPGWKRSFWTALASSWRNYDFIAHVESDCYIFESGRAKFLDFLCRPGYFTGWCPSQHIPESGLQILNDMKVVLYYLENYGPVGWERVRQVELDVEELGPQYILKGDRHEEHPERCKPDYDYMAQVPWWWGRTQGAKTGESVRPLRLDDLYAQPCP